MWAHNDIWPTECRPCTKSMLPADWFTKIHLKTTSSTNQWFPGTTTAQKKKKPIYHLATPQCLAPNLYGSSHCCTNECLLWPLSTVGKKMSQQWLRCYLGDFSDFNAPWKVSGCMSTVWTTNRSCPPTYDVRASYSVSSLLQFPPGKGQLNTPSSNFHSDQWLRCDCFHGTDNAL